MAVKCATFHGAEIANSFAIGLQNTFLLKINERVFVHPRIQSILLALATINGT
jgi:hypothetical protein